MTKMGCKRPGIRWGFGRSGVLGPRTRLPWTAHRGCCQGPVSACEDFACFFLMSSLLNGRQISARHAHAAHITLTGTLSRLQQQRTPKQRATLSQTVSQAPGPNSCHNAATGPHRPRRLLLSSHAQARGGTKGSCSAPNKMSRNPIALGKSVSVPEEYKVYNHHSILQQL